MICEGFGADFAKPLFFVFNRLGEKMSEPLLILDNGNLMLIVLGIVITAEVISITIGGKGWTNKAIKLIGITTISFLAILAALVVPHNSKEALTGAYGILGGIAGYLFGVKNE
jgi:hypothetical protein